MYALISDGLEIARSSTQGISIVAGKIAAQINAAATLNVTLSQSNEFRYAIQPRRSLVQVLRDSEEIWRGQVTGTHTDTNGNVQYSGLSDLSYLQDSMAAPFEYNGSAQVLLGLLLDGHNSVMPERKRIYLGTVNKTGLGRSFRVEQTGYRKTWAILSDLLKKYGGYMALRTGDDGKRYLDWLDHSGRFSAQRIAWGYNLTGINVDDAAGDVITCLYATTSAGLVSTLYDYEAIDAYGEIWGTAQFEAETPAELATLARAYLDQHKRADRAVTASAVDKRGDGVPPLYVGDFAMVISPPHHVEEWLPVTRIETDLTDVKAPKISLGAMPVSLTQGGGAGASQVTAEWVAGLQGIEPPHIYAIDVYGRYAVDSRYVYALGG